MWRENAKLQGSALVCRASSSNPDFALHPAMHVRSGAGTSLIIFGFRVLKGCGSLDCAKFGRQRWQLGDAFRSVGTAQAGRLPQLGSRPSRASSHVPLATGTGRARADPSVASELKHF